MKKWHGKSGQCWKLFSECTSGPDKGYKTYCIRPKGHEGRCSNTYITVLAPRKPVGNNSEVAA